MAGGRGNVLKTLARRRKTVRTMPIVALIATPMDTVHLVVVTVAVTSVQKLNVRNLIGLVIGKKIKIDVLINENARMTLTALRLLNRSLFGVLIGAGTV